MSRSKGRTAAQGNLLVTRRRLSSVFPGRDPELLQAMLEFYAPSPTACVADVTCNERRMWEGVSWSGEVMFCDVDPDVAPDVVCDFRDLPFPDASFDVLVFDPPHLPAAAGTEASDEGFSRRHGLSKSVHGDNVSDYFPPFLAQASRVLRPEGVVLAKLCDFVHNHRHQWSLVDFINAVREAPGLTPCDLVVKRDPSAGRFDSGRWENVYHARNAHAWWVVVRKGRCEPKNRNREDSET